MLEFEIRISPELAGDMATRIMSLWPELEVKTNENTVVFGLPLDERLDENLKMFEESLQALEKARAVEGIDVKCRNLGGPDFASELVRVGRFLIAGPDEGVQPGGEDILLRLDAGFAFGTGRHPSTALVLKAMEEYFSPIPGSPSRAGVSVLDAGTGSGILALAAARLGAGSVLGVDSSHEAVDSAARNAALNDLSDRLQFAADPVEKVEGQFDLVLANLVPSVLLRARKKLVSRLSPQGTMIASGFADTQTPQIVKALTKSKLVTRKSYSHCGWGALSLVFA